MARLKNDHFLRGASGRIGKSLMVKTVGKKTTVSKVPRPPRKRSQRQKENAAKFADIARAAKFVLNDPEIKAYYQRVAIKRGQASAYVAALKEHLETNVLPTTEVLLEKARQLVVVKKSVDTESSRAEIIVTTANGDIVAQGFAVREDNQWKYIAPITGLQIVVRDPKTSR